MDYPKRLIEVDLPIKRISAHARREKSIRHGHISTLHIWWARRPLAACRAVTCATLWPDPADERCPPAFRDEARRLMREWAKNHLDLTSPESMSHFNRVKNDPEVLADNVELRKALLDFIADFADWDNSAKSEYLTVCRALTLRSAASTEANDNTHPFVFDPFAGGGSIPLEAARVSAEVFASDLNPIPILLNRTLVEYIPAHGDALAEQVRHWGGWIRSRLDAALRRFYPMEPDGSEPAAYLWARTISCEGPGCGATVPLLRSLVIAKRSTLAAALRIVPEPSKKRVRFAVLRKQGSRWVDPDDPSSSISAADLHGTVKRGSATCPCCGFTTPVDRIRIQLKSRRGGGDDAQLMCVFLLRGDGSLSVREASEHDLTAVNAASEYAARHGKQNNSADSFIPDETISLDEIRRISVPIYGMTSWGDLFTRRQAVALATLCWMIREELPKAMAGQPQSLIDATRTCLALSVGKCADYWNTIATWMTRGTVGHAFTRQAIPMTWDFAEANPLAPFHCAWHEAYEWVASVCDTESAASSSRATVVHASATTLPLPDDSADALITDPPYYDAVPYAHLSDFFYVWHRRSIGDIHPDILGANESPKKQEIVVDRPHELSKSCKTIAFYEKELTKAFADSRRVLKPSGIGVIVFASKTTASWEAILEAVVDAGWLITGSWPIDTEREARMAAQGQARLASSVHLVCRPREDSTGATIESVGDWRTVLAELPRRIREWMPRLAEEGVVGADAIFACLGPALEIFSQYSSVEKASGEVVTLREYLEQVWAAVSTEALSMIFRDADAAGLESDARFTAIVLWTLGAGASGSSEDGAGDAGETEAEDDEDDSPKENAAKGGYTLEYDAARKIAQGLGVNLEQIDSVVEVKGDKARLLPVSERAATLFGKAEKAEAATKKRGKKATQKKLFDKDAEEGSGKTETVTLGDGATATPGVTALDRVHQAMLLFANGRADALKRFIVEDGVGGDARFWKLAQSLSALYPAGSDEKRWVDGVLARKKTFGF